MVVGGEMARHQKEIDTVLIIKVDERQDGVNPLVRETDDYQINSIKIYKNQI